MSYETVDLQVNQGIATLSLNRPAQANALNRTLWEDLRASFSAVETMDDVRVVILTGNGRHFCGGIDLAMLGEITGLVEKHHCRARATEAIRRYILDLQDVFNRVERCSKPVIGAIAGACIGAGVDLATACDLRYSTQDARFCLKEIDLGIVADVGAIQRLPRLVGDGRSREMIYTGRNITGHEAAVWGLVNEALASTDALLERVHEVARGLADKSPLTLRGCKQSILYSQEHTVADSLAHVALWNAGMLVSDDLREASAAAQEKRQPYYRD